MKDFIKEVKRFFSKSAVINSEYLDTYRRDPIRYFFARKLVLTMQYNERKSLYLQKKIRRVTKLLRWEHRKVERRKALYSMARYNTQFIDIISALFDCVDITSNDIKLIEDQKLEKLMDLKNRAYHLINLSKRAHFTKGVENEVGN